MKADRIIGVALLLLAAGVAAGAILGPLLLGVIEFRVSESAENQLIGGELVSLFLVAPVAVLAGLLCLRGHRLAPLLAIAPALYAVYTYLTFILGPAYDRYPGNNERAFPLYAALILLGWMIVARAWPALDSATLPRPGRGLRRILAVLLFAIGSLFTLTWVAGIIDVLDGGPLPDAYVDDPTLFWLIRLLDLAFVLPVVFITAVGLVRQAAWASKLAAILAGFGTLLAGSVAGMAAVMVARDDPSASPAMLAATAAITAGLALTFVRLIRVASRAAEAGDAGARPAGEVMPPGGPARDGRSVPAPPAAAHRGR